MTEVENRLNAYDSDWEELPDIYVAKTGDTMTGPLVMSGNNITNLASGGTTDTNAANIGDVKSAVNGHATVKATGTILGHVTLSDATNGTQDADDGVAATPKAVADAYALAESAKSLAEGIDLTPFIKKDGTVAMEADLDLGTHKLIHVVDPVADQDAATKKYVDTEVADHDTAVRGGYTGTLKDLNDAIVDEAELRKSGDEALDARIQPIEAVIDGITGAMHFIGVSSTNPIAVDGDENSGKVTVDGTEITTFEDGDVIVYSTKEYVYSDNAWVELGDVTAEAQRIKELEETINTANTGLVDRMTAVEGEIDVLQSNEEDLEGRVEALEEWKDDTVTPALADHAGRIGTLETTVNTTHANLLSGLRTDLGEATATAGTGSAFARIAGLEAENATQNSAIVGLGNQLTWTSFDPTE